MKLGVTFMPSVGVVPTYIGTEPFWTGDSSKSCMSTLMQQLLLSLELLSEIDFSDSVVLLLFFEGMASSDMIRKVCFSMSVLLSINAWTSSCMAAGF